MGQANGHVHNISVSSDVWVRELDVLAEVTTSHSRFHMCDEVTANLNCSWRSVHSRYVHQNSSPGLRIKAKSNPSDGVHDVGDFCS